MMVLNNRKVREMKYLVRKTVIFEKMVEAESKKDALEVFDLNYGELYSDSSTRSEVAIKIDDAGVFPQR